MWNTHDHSGWRVSRIKWPRGTTQTAVVRGVENVDQMQNAKAPTAEDLQKVSALVPSTIPAL